MMERKELKKIARARLKDAEALFNARRYDGAVYLCGYAIELALKNRICKTLKWEEYPVSKKLNNFKTHDLALLLQLAGIEKKISTTFFAEWSIVSEWNSELRYQEIGSVTKDEAQLMIDSTKILLKRI
ncbi:MAG: HEPN domain-containing protein [Desulfobacteraceae bacterium]|nr:HEPN domain-containing protein [Desulfobacteraceae bacterium]